MKLNSITFKLLFSIICIFLVTTITVLSLAKIQLKRILDKSQDAVYTEKIDTILGILQASDRRLQKTGMVEAYEAQFKDAAVKGLADSYYRRSHPAVFPFILDTRGRVVMHHLVETGGTAPISAASTGQLIGQPAGSFNLTVKDKKYWCVSKSFPPWGWTVAYMVPLDIKYADAREFDRMLILIMIALGLMAVMLVSFFVTRFTRPVIRLTETATGMAGGDLDREIQLGGKDEVGSLARSFSHMRDAVKEKIVELDKLHSYLSNIIDSMPSVLIGVDARARVTQWNKTAEQATGIPARTAQGKRLSEVFPRMAGKMETIRESIRTRQVKQDHTRYATGPPDQTCYEDITIYPLMANGVEGAVIRVDDVTEKVRLEEMMVQSEKMLSVGGLAAGMAHEINNPLAGIIQTASVMANRLALKDHIPANQTAARKAGISLSSIQAYMEDRKIPGMIEAINESGRRVAEIVANMLGFARKSVAQISDHALEDIIDKTLELAATDYDLKNEYDFKLIRIKREFAPAMPKVPCEAPKIQQVLLNIFRNGAQAMQGAGTAAPGFTIRTRLKNKMACMEIQDNGPGMDETVRKRIFEPFFTTKPIGIGTGLGLSVSYFIITEDHGGNMSVASRPGSGTSFTICLPLKRSDI